MTVCVADREGQPLWLFSLCRGELLFTRRGLYPTWQRHSVPNNGLHRNAGRMEAGGGLWTDAMHWTCDVMVWSLTALTKVTGSGCFIAVQYIHVIEYCIICYCLMYSTVYCKVRYKIQRVKQQFTAQDLDSEILGRLKPDRITHFCSIDRWMAGHITMYNTLKIE